MPSSRGFSQSKDRTYVSCIAGRFFTSWATRGARFEDEKGSISMCLESQTAQLIWATEQRNVSEKHTIHLAEMTFITSFEKQFNMY